MSGFDSISSLLNKGAAPSDDDSPQGRLLAKQKEIQLKKIEQQTESQAAALGLDYVNLFGFPISPEAIGLISEEESRQYNIVCFYYDGEHVRLGTTTPEEPMIQDIITRINTQYFTKSRLYVISPNSIDNAWGFYKNLPKVKKYDSGVEIKEEDLEKFKSAISSYKSLNEQINKVNISDIVTLILATAMKTGASDIHIAAGIPIRFRIDGRLVDADDIALATEDCEDYAQQIIEDSYEGSLKNFVCAFTENHKLTSNEKEELLTYIHSL